jgi:hypothetical protein
MFVKALKILASIAVLTGLAASAQAEPTYLSGRISNVAFAGDQTMIMLDTGLPGNCAGSPYGWMIIPGEYKAMAAFVLGLWMRGDAPQVQVTVYTDGLVLGGYCRINQVDPAG